jgi:CheY-like chemotaxis protein
MHMGKVLVVDDIAVVSMAMRMILERAGHAVETASDGAEALKVVAIRVPDVVITDLWMPNVDGLQLIQTLRSQFPAVGVVAMSGGSRQYNGESSLDRARDAGANQLLMKPVSQRDLLDAVGKSMLAKSALAATGSSTVTATPQL